ncbi:MAG TPA: hypothetical protein VGD56_02485 [Gemmatirosa sp.]
MPRPHQLLLSLAAGLGLAACGSHDATTAPVPAVQGIKAVAGGSVTDTVLSTPLQALVVEVRGPGGSLAKGSVVRFSVQSPKDSTRRAESTMYVCPLTATTCGPTTAYPPNSSANVSTDTVDANGHAKTLVRLGTVAGPTYVIVTVPEFGMTDSVPFTVTPGAARNVTFATHDVPLLVGGKATLRAAVTDTYLNPRTDPVSFTLGSTPGVATLDAATGTLTAVDLGTVYAYARAGSAADPAVVRVVPKGRLLVWDAQNRAIRLINTDGTGQRALEGSVSSDFGAFPHFSPSAAVVAFHAGSTDYGGPPGRLVIMDSSGANRREVGLPAGVTYVAYARPLATGAVLFIGHKPSTGYPSYSNPASVFSVATDGTVTELAALPNPANTYGGASISPDGTRVAYESVDPNSFYQGTGVQVFTIATGQTTLVDASGTSPSWSPTSDRVAFLSGTATSGGTGGALTIVNADGSGRTSFSSAGSFSPGIAWSPDGAYLLARDANFISSGLIAVRARDGVSVTLRLPAFGANPYSAFGDYYQPDWH